jgi:hypothetical protein
MYPRICLFGLPRCGSQYIAELIKTNSEYNILDLHELYTSGLGENMQPLPVLNEKNELYCKFLPEYDDLNILPERIDYIYKTLKQNTIMPLILRLFPYDYLIKYMPTIVEHLKENNFSFFLIKRLDVEKHFLSYVIAQTTNQWTQFKDKDRFRKKVKIDLSIVKNSKWLIQSSDYFLEYAEKINIKGPIIHYENAISDLSTLYTKSFNNDINIEKQGFENPYDQIINANEVRELVQSFLSK